MFLLEIMKHLSGSGLPSFLLSLTGHCYKCVFHQTSDKTKEVQHNVLLCYLHCINYIPEQKPAKSKLDNKVIFQLDTKVLGKVFN